MGDKIEAKRTAKRLGIPVVPGSDGAVTDDDEAQAHRRRDRLSGAHQGVGRRRRARHEGGAQRRRPAESRSPTARAEAGAAFGDDAVYIEKYLDKPRHIEVQVFGDGKGNAVHLGERDCSLQRRHQKVWEEAPSPALDAEQRARIGGICRQGDAELGYSGAGTIEFLYENGEFYFIEMNTRLQVEHPVTEAITGIDLVHEQIRVASGGGLSFTQEDVSFHGPRHRMPHQRRGSAHLRALARHDHLLPRAGRPRRARRFRRLSGLHDPALLRQPDRQADRARPQPRQECMMRLRRALDEFVVDGIKTTLPLFRDLVDDPDIANGDYDIHWLEKHARRRGREQRSRNDRSRRHPASRSRRASAQGLCRRRLPDGRKSAEDPGAVLGRAGDAAASFRSTASTSRAPRADDAARTPSRSASTAISRP